VNRNAPFEDGHQATWALLVAILAAVGGALLPTALNTSSGIRVLGLVLGAAIPPLVTHVGPAQGLRIGLAIGVSVLALVVAYGGFTVFAFAFDQPSALPVPPGVPNPAPGHTSSGPDIGVAPSKVQCDSNGCDDVTVTSTGSKTLHILNVELKQETAGFSQESDCEGRYLDKDKTCTINVNFSPSGAAGTRTADLIIHQNIPYPDRGTHVTLEGKVEVSQPVGDLVVSADDLRCEYVTGVQIDGEYTNAIQITFSVRLEDSISDSPPTQVALSASMDDREPRRIDDFSTQQADSLALVLESTDFGQEQVITVKVDPDGELPEIHEDNNRQKLKVDLPLQPQSFEPLRCEFING